jgi:hypothetical protein
MNKLQTIKFISSAVQVTLTQRAVPLMPLPRYVNYQSVQVVESTIFRLVTGGFFVILNITLN